MMLLINMNYPQHQSEISGIDKIFVAPELIRKNEPRAENDIWSIGTILYLLITGGIKDKKWYAEKFDFKETQWQFVTQELTDFIKFFVRENPKKRMTIKELLDSDFITIPNLTHKPMNETFLIDYSNLLQFQSASVLNQVILRKNVINKVKLRKIDSIYEEFMKKATVESAVMSIEKKRKEHIVSLQFSEI